MHNALCCVMHNVLQCVGHRPRSYYRGYALYNVQCTCVSTSVVWIVHCIQCTAVCCMQAWVTLPWVCIGSTLRCCQVKLLLPEHINTGADATFWLQRKCWSYTSATWSRRSDILHTREMIVFCAAQCVLQEGGCSTGIYYTVYLGAPT